MNSTETKDKDKKVEKTDKIKKVKPTKKKIKKNITSGIAFVNATFNNTIVSISDEGGNVMIWGEITFDAEKKPSYSAGQCLHSSILDPYVLPFLNANPGITFQQDCARPHTARATIDHLNHHYVNRG